MKSKFFKNNTGIFINYTWKRNLLWSQISFLSLQFNINIYNEMFYTYQEDDFKLKHKFKGIQYKCSHLSIPYQVHTCPDLVRARENWAPHSIWHTFWSRSLSTSWGTLQPSLPPRPSFPKSPSPQEYTLPSSVRARVWASLLPQATCTTRSWAKALT